MSQNYRAKTKLTPHGINSLIITIVIIVLDTISRMGKPKGKGGFNKKTGARLSPKPKERKCEFGWDEEKFVSDMERSIAGKIPTVCSRYL